MPTLDGILNFVIPIGIIIIFVGLIYWKLKEPVDNIFKLIGRGLGKLFEAFTDSLTGNTSTEVTYK